VGGDHRGDAVQRPKERGDQLRARSRVQADERRFAASKGAEECIDEATLAELAEGVFGGGAEAASSGRRAGLVAEERDEGRDGADVADAAERGDRRLAHARAGVTEEPHQRRNRAGLADPGELFGGADAGRVAVPEEEAVLIDAAAGVLNRFDEDADLVVEAGVQVPQTGEDRGEELEERAELPHVGEHAAAVEVEDVNPGRVMGFEPALVVADLQPDARDLAEVIADRRRLQ
jgi:hypothetical protein